MSIESALISYKKELYKDYIYEHMQNVQKAWNNMKNIPECLELINKYCPDSINVIDNMIKNHDQSKYSKEEFNSYRKQFFPINVEEKKQNKAAFDRAWEHHYMNNPHHWDYWDKIGSDMPFIYIVEMVCDWEAMGYKFGNTSLEWYNDNKDKIHIGDEQRKFAESLMELMNK